MIADFPIHWHDLGVLVRPLIATGICNVFSRRHVTDNRRRSTSTATGGCVSENRFALGLPGHHFTEGVSYRVHSHTFEKCECPARSAESR